MAFINKDNIHRVHINKDYLSDKEYMYTVMDFANLYPSTIRNFEASKYYKTKTNVKFIKSFK